MRQNSQVVKRKEYVPPIEWCDEAWVEKKFGVPADKIVDLLGLMGDSIDNIPGAPGIGSKGAVQIVTQFGSIEEALKRWEEVKHKTYRESLRNNAELILQSKDLARIRTDLDVELNLDEIRSRPPDRAAAYQLFKELEFSALTREFADAAVAVSVQEGAPLDYKVVDSLAALEGLIKSLWDAESVSIALTDSTSALDAAPRRPATAAIADADAEEELIVDQQCAIDFEAPQVIAFSSCAWFLGCYRFRKVWR